ncbi:hypothetical protein [Novipirellula artificiosorum]|uniref:Uncharacterized protein n=1 Tax=Novipirellula artificiosorum TaxID=2528016 RepID=A0A5C6DVL8_9BACT|nr:hypothetical protein [Novipirellula artificiosorum]TWU40750.1 hypothetical protein Poly41_15850 [Novipirellula artificiosorum]
MAFEPFFVECLTCGSRLRVSDPGLVGTIATCPKCSSMVAIEPPTPTLPANQRPAGGQVAVGNANVDSEQITRDALSANEMGSATETHPPLVPSDGFLGSDSVAPDTIHDSTPPIDPDAWQSARTRQSRQVALVVAVSMASLITAIAVFVWFVRSRNRPENLAPVEASTTAPLTDQAAVDATALPSTEPTQTPPPENNPNLPPQSPVTAEDSLLEPAVTSAPVDSPKVDSAVIPADLMPVDPLAMDSPKASPPTPIIPPLSDGVAPADSNADVDGPDTDDASLQALPPGLAKYTILLDLGGEANEVKPTIDAPPVLDLAKWDAAAEESLDPMMIATPPPIIDPKSALAIEFAFDSKGYPLGDLVLLLSQITGVPIQIDWVSFEIAGFDIQNRILTPRGILSAKKHLEAICEACAGEIQIEESLLILTLRDAAFTETIDRISDVEDFADAQASAIETLDAFLNVSSDQDDQAKAATVPLGSTRSEQQLSLLAIDSLRRMRGIEPKIASPFFDHWAHAIGSPNTDWAKLEGGDSGPPFDTPITIAGLLRQVSRRNGATCVVNWFDANRRRMSPEQLTLPYTKDDAGEMLRRTLLPFEVQVRRVDAGHWWVGTEASYDRLSVIAWSRPLGDHRDAFLQHIGQTMGGASSDVFRVVYDAQSDRALMMMPRYIARQLPKTTESIWAQ